MSNTSIAVAPDANPFARCGINGYTEATTVTERLERVCSFHAADCEKALALPDGFLPSTVRKAVELRRAYLKQRGLA